MRWIWIATGAVALLVAPGTAGAQDVVALDRWQMQSSAVIDAQGEGLSAPGFRAADWHAVTVPTTVLAALVEGGVYPDPYYGENLRSIPGYQEGRWLRMPDGSPFGVPWWFRTEFPLPEGFAGKHVTLCLDGINYRADVWMNGRKVASRDEVVGMFRRFEFDVTAAARVGEMNALAIEVVPPGQLPEKDYRSKQVEATTGWDDHNPQPPDMNLGIWQPVSIRATGPVRIRHPYVATDLDVPSLRTARLTVSAVLENLSDSPQTAGLSGAIDGRVVAQSVDLGAGETRLITFAPGDFGALIVEEPRVWWPHPVGPQELYDLNLTCTVDSGVSDTADVEFGIRNITSSINDEGWRTFTVNGKRILIRGGAWMTSDMLLRLTPRRYDALVRYAREANLNMLRSEGFSIRETDTFYSLCDRYGVMVTQQIFGRSIPDEDLAIACTEDTILRIRNHPSLVHFLGHDETFPTERLDAAYRDLLARYAPDRTYQPHSGAFDVVDRFRTGGTRTGTRELWTYANPKHYYERKEDGAWGFAQSGGIGGIVAPFESVRRMIPEHQRWPLWTDALSFHTVIQGGPFFDVVVQMLDARYGEAGDLETFCRKAQAMNYESARGMFEAYGRNKYSATGITTWKYNAAWPAFMTWQYVDWYLIANGAYYGAKKACRAVHVQYSYDDDSVWVVNGLYEPFEGAVTARVFNLDMAEKGTRTAAVAVEADGKAGVFTMEWPQGLTKSYFLVLSLDDAGGHRVDDSFYWLSTVPDTRGTVKDSWRDFAVHPESIADHTALNGLPPAAVDSAAAFETRGDETIARVTLRNPSSHVAFFIRLAVHQGPDGDEAAPAFWDDNFVSLLPGEERTVRGVVYTRDLGGAEPVLRVSGWNLAAGG
ncbi:MAG: hypothetical protein JXR94_06905 [Candidatus Hydrogenedentes bacterium]|nr:hypothetical protein [Candidatus Hydrogenedentota bacterium]